MEKVAFGSLSQPLDQCHKDLLLLQVVAHKTLVEWKYILISSRNCQSYYRNRTALVGIGAAFPVLAIVHCAGCGYDNPSGGRQSYYMCFYPMSHWSNLAVCQWFYTASNIVSCSHKGGAQCHALPSCPSSYVFLSVVLPPEILLPCFSQWPSPDFTY